MEPKNGAAMWRLSPRQITAKGLGILYPKPLTWKPGLDLPLVHRAHLGRRSESATCQNLGWLHHLVCLLMSFCWSEMPVRFKVSGFKVPSDHPSTLKHLRGHFIPCIQRQAQNVSKRFGLHGNLGLWRDFPPFNMEGETHTGKKGSANPIIFISYLYIYI